MNQSIGFGDQEKEKMTSPINWCNQLIPLLINIEKKELPFGGAGLAVCIFG